jgi:hypothetical protein
MASQTELSSGIVAYQEFWGAPVPELIVNVVAATAFDISANKRNGCISCGVGGREGRNQVRGVFDRKLKTEWMRTLKFCAQHVC